MFDEARGESNGRGKDAELNGVIDRGREIEMRKREREEEELMSDEARSECKTKADNDEEKVMRSGT